MLKVGDAQLFDQLIVGCYLINVAPIVGSNKNFEPQTVIRWECFLDRIDREITPKVINDIICCSIEGYFKRTFRIRQ